MTVKFAVDGNMEINQAPLFNQINSLSTRLDELNRITRNYAIGASANEVSREECTKTCASQIPKLCVNSELDLPDRIPQKRWEPSDDDHMPDVELLTLQDRQFQLQNTLSELMGRMQHRQEIRSHIEQFKEHDVDDHLKNNSVKRCLVKPEPASKKPTSRLPLKKPVVKRRPVGRNNNAPVEMGAVHEYSDQKKTLISKSRRTTDQKPDEHTIRKSVSFPDLSAHRSPERNFSPLGVSPLKNESNARDDALQAVKEELTLMREMFGSELKDVRNFIQTNRMEIEKCLQPHETTNTSADDKENAAIDVEKPATRIKSSAAEFPTPLTPLDMAERALMEAKRRRENLEQNLVTMQRTKQSQGVFDILGLLGQDDDAYERARIKALVDDAISGVHNNPEKIIVKSTKNLVSSRINELSRPKQLQVRPIKKPLQHGKKVVYPMTAREQPASQRLGLTSLIGSPTRMYKQATHSLRPVVCPSWTRGDEKTKQPSQISSSKSVRFHDDKPCEASETPTQTYQPLQKQFHQITRPRRTLQPLGMRQYSMWPPESPVKHVSAIPPPSLGEFEDHLNRQHSHETVFLQDLPQPHYQERESNNLTDTLLRKQVEEDVISRLLRQLTTATMPQPPAPQMHDPGLRNLIEAALLERLQRGNLFLRDRMEFPPINTQNNSLSCVSNTDTTRICSPQRDFITEITESLPSPSRTTSPQKIASVPHVSLRDRSASARPVSSLSSRHPPALISRALSAQSLNQRKTPNSRHDFASSHTLNNLTSLSADDLNDKTLDNLPTDSRTPSLIAVGSKQWRSFQHHSPISADRHRDRSVINAALVDESCGRTAGSAVKGNNGNRTQLSAPDSSVNSLTSASEWSSTAPHSFSDGIWLEDRSEGEQGRFCLDSQQARMLAVRLGPLPIDNSSTSKSDKSGSALAANNAFLEGMEDDATSPLSTDEFTVNRINKQKGAWIAPWKDPVLHLIALNASGKNSRLPWNRYVQVQRLAATLRKQGCNKVLADFGLTSSPECLDTEDEKNISLDLGENRLQEKISFTFDSSAGEIRPKSNICVSSLRPEDVLPIQILEPHSEYNTIGRLAGMTNNNNINDKNNNSTANEFGSLLSAAQPFSDDEEEDIDEVTYTTQWDSSHSVKNSMIDHSLEIQRTCSIDRSLTVHDSVNKTFTITTNDDDDDDIEK